MVFTIFDRDALIAALKDHVKREKTFHRIGNNDLEYERISIDEWDKKMTDIALKGANGTNGQGTNIASSNAEEITRNISAAAEPVYADEIPPFDVTISFANEYGQKSVIVLYACEILNESSGFSIDNVVSEKACTFVARKVEYMKPVDRDGTSDEFTSWSATS